MESFRNTWLYISDRNRKTHRTATLLGILVAIWMSFLYPIPDCRLNLMITTNWRSVEFLIEDSPGRLVSSMRSTRNTESPDGLYVHSFHIPFNSVSAVLIKPRIMTSCDTFAITELEVRGRNLPEQRFVAESHSSHDLSSILSIKSDYSIMGWDGVVNFTKISFASNAELMKNIIDYYNSKLRLFYFGYVLSFFLFSILFVLFFRFVLAVAECNSEVFERYADQRFIPYLVLIGLLIFLDCIVFFDFLRFDQYFIFIESLSDSLEQNWPFVTAFIRDARAGDVFWSSEYGLGTSLLSISSMYGMLNPVNLLYFLFDISAIPGLFIYVILIKQIIGTTGFFLLLRTFRINSIAAIICSLAFAFSGFFTGYGSWLTGFGDSALMITPWILLATVLHRRIVRAAVLPILAAIWVVSTQGYISVYHCLIMIILFFVFRHFSARQTENPRVFLKNMLGILIDFTLGVGMIGVVFIPATLISFNTIIGLRSADISRISVFLNSSEAVNGWFRIFGNDLLRGDSIGLGCCGIDYVESPFIYIGTFSILLIALCAGTRSLRRSVRMGIPFLAVSLTIIVSPLIRSFFWGGFESYHRNLSLIFPIFGCLLSALLMDSLIRQPADLKHHPMLIAILLVVLLVVSASFTPPGIRASVDKILLVWVCIALPAHALLIRRLSQSECTASALAAMLVLVLVEFGFFSYRTVNTVLNALHPWDIEIADIDQTVQRLKKMDTSFYRIGDAARMIGSNEPLLLNYRGFSTYSSLNSSAAVKCLRNLDSFSGDHRRLNDPMMSHSFKSLFVMKYSVQKMWDGGYRINENRDCVPFGAVYKRLIPESMFDGLDSDLKRLVLPVALVVDESVCRMYPEIPILSFREFPTSDSLEALAKATRVPHFKHRIDTDSRIEGRITVDSTALILFQIPFEKGWRIRIDGKDTSIIKADYGLMAVGVEHGSHQIELYYQPPGWSIGLALSIMSITIYSSIVFSVIFFQRTKLVQRV